MKLFSETHQYSSVFSAMSVFCAPICLESTARTRSVLRNSLFLSFCDENSLSKSSDKMLGGNAWRNWQLYPPWTFCLQCYNSITTMTGKPGLLHEQNRMAQHGETLQVVLCRGKLSLSKCTWTDPKFGQSRANMGGDSVFYPNILKKEK